MPDFEVKVLRTDDYMRILQDEKKLTFAVVVNNHETHHQLSIMEYDTRDKIEKRMAEVGIQVFEEMTANKNFDRAAPIPKDIQSLVDEYKV